MIIYSDGYTIKSNPSKIGGGYVIMDEHNNVLKIKDIKKKGMTNNETELLGVLEATKLAKKNDTIITDSQNTYWWVMRRKCKARKDLKVFAQEAYINILEKKLKLIVVKRNKNLAGRYIQYKLIK